MKIQLIISVFIIISSMFGVGCRKEKGRAGEEDAREVLAKELRGIYEAQQSRIKAGVNDTVVDFLPIRLTSTSSNTKSVSLYFDAALLGELDVKQVVEERVLMDFRGASENLHNADGSHRGLISYFAGESKFSGCAAVYDRKAMTLQVSLKAREQIKGAGGREEVTDYILEYTARKIE